MDAGMLNRLITIQSQTVATDEYGNAGSRSWSTVASCWARVQPQGASESVQADKRQSQGNTLFTIYYRASVNNTCRIVYNGNNYNVTDVQEIGYRQYLQLTGELTQ